MVILTRTRCGWCAGTGHRSRHRSRHRYNCSKCGGPGYTTESSTFQAVIIGPGWVDTTDSKRTTEQQINEWRMLAGAVCEVR